MQKSFNRIQSGPHLLLVFVVSFSIFISLPHKYSPQSQSKSITNISTMALDTFGPTEGVDEFEIEDQFDFSELLKPTIFNSYLKRVKSLAAFSFIKAPLLYYLFAIPPPHF